MDQPNLGEVVHQGALNALARINWFSASSGIFWPPLRELSQQVPQRTIRVLDIGCGGGDVTLALARRARLAGRKFQFAGCDVSPVALDWARRRATHAGEAVEFFPLNVLESPLPADYDVIICSLFLHHLDESQAERLLRRMGDAANRLVLVNDLVRGRWGYLMAVVASRLLTTSHVVHVDGPLSVAGAFTPQEALDLAEYSGRILVD